MDIKFYAHACFRLEDGEVSVVTDPYTPGPEVSNFDPINEPADIVLMSSATDRFHSCPDHITGNPEVVNTLELPKEGTCIKGVEVKPYPTTESQTFDYGRDPDDNAMYWFTIDGLRMLHIGDIGTAIPDNYLKALSGQVDILFALTGGQPTIPLDDLDAAIEAIQPRVVIPMHYYHERGRLKILPVTDFTNRHPKEKITWVGDSHLSLTTDTLPAEQHIYVLEQSR